MKNVFKKNKFHVKVRSACLFLLCMAEINVFAVTQQKTITLQMKQASLIAVFDKLEELSGKNFLYNAELIKGKGLVDVNAVDQTIEKILDSFLPSKGLAYSINDNQIIIRAQVSEPETYIIRGKVVDEKGNPLPGATVILDSTTVGTATDSEGKFMLKLPQKTGTLIFTFVGYKSIEKKFSADKELLVTMSVDASDLDEVQVIGYGNRKKREVVGAISSVKAEDIKDVPSPSLENLLQGRIAGLGVFQQSGSPGGGGNSVAVRGYNSLLDDEAAYKSSGAPLYIIDGVPVNSFTSPVTGTNTLAEIDPSTIESIDVLKVADSAAIYG